MKWGFQRNPNRSARNGKFFGYEGRNDDVDLVVIHTGEIAPDTDGEDSAAEVLSRFMGNESHSRVAWHATVDADSILHELPSEWTGAHVRNWNSRTIGIEIATRHDVWDELPESHRRLLVSNTGLVAAWFCQRWGLPIDRVATLDAARKGGRGLVAHSTLDPARRSDPGPDFPWETLLTATEAFSKSTLVAIGDRGVAVVDAQRTLHDQGLGHLVGPVDGVAGPLFDDAMRALERQRGWPETGIWGASDNARSGATDSDDQPSKEGDRSERESSPIVLSASVGNGGTNRPDDVRAVSNRLDELGFIRPDRSLGHAITLFQAAKDGDERVVGNDGRVDPGHDTLAWLNAANAPRWVHMPRGSDQEGFRSKERTQIHDDHGWGTSWLADMLRRAGRIYRDRHLDKTSGAPLIWSNDASPKRGGDTRDHAGHEAGMQLDLVVPPGNSTVGGVTWRSQRYDRTATRQILLAFREAGPIRTIFFNDPVLIGEGLCRSAGGHDNHIHVHINPPSRSTPNRPAPTDLRIDWDFIRQQEGFRTKAYVPNVNGVVIGRSGVTIGSGFDLGQHSADYLDRLGAPGRLIELLRRYFGLKGQRALDFLTSHPLDLAEHDVKLLDELVKADKARNVERAYDGASDARFTSLPAAAQTVIVSVLFQYGSPNRVSRFWGFALARNYQGMIAELRDFGDDFPSRRRREAAYLEQGLWASDGDHVAGAILGVDLDGLERVLKVLPGCSVVGGFVVGGSHTVNS